MNHTTRILITIMVSLAVVTGCRAELSGVKGEELRREAAKSLSEQEVTSIAEGNNRFALEMYGELQDSEGNLFFSPYSIQQAFGMASAMAEGRSLKEIREVMRFNLPQKRVHTGFAGINGKLERWVHSSCNEILISNAVFTPGGFKPPREFADFLRDYYEAVTIPIDVSSEMAINKSRKKMDDWISDQTEGFLEQATPRDFLHQGTMLVLANTAYMNAGWEADFPVDNTEDRGFTLADGKVVKTPTMYMMHASRISANEEAKVLHLAYQASPLEMVIVLPHETDGLANLESGLTNDKLQEWLKSGEHPDVEIYLPKFAFENSIEMVKPLRRLGMEAPFSGGFDKVLPGSYIGRVFHGSKVKVDEKGTVAGAVTLVRFDAEMMTEDLSVFRADHPFMFIIRDCETGVILFMGRVVDPRT